MTTIVPLETAKPAVQAALPRVGVLLVNLGTPDTADAPGVRVYLKEFLSDPRVIEDQGLIWQLVLNGIILRSRPRTKALDYRKIWNTERNESPLKTITRSQRDKLAAALSDRSHVVVDWAMRYGNPSIKAGIDALIARDANAFSPCRCTRNIPRRPRRPSATKCSVCSRACGRSRRCG